jgi:hypothetical protein
MMRGLTNVKHREIYVPVYFEVCSITGCIINHVHNVIMRYRHIRRSAAALLLGSRVRNPLRAWVFPVLCLLCFA